ncbi:LacI family DNA-binding transcriptional regulator [Sphingomonas sp.]|uniref:LacI family DNA-binding transcriptional regulator n=1 Tax=Sphingomonas sp. TaxID=28214 RepID=UPI0039C9BFC6
MSNPTSIVRTLADLARLAGVSPGTVSRALAGKSIVNDATRQRIEALATQHNFQPNQMARRLRTQQTGVIGIALPLGHERRQHISDPFFLTLFGHLADALTERNYDVMLSRIIPDAEDWLSRVVRSGMVDGVLLIGQSDQFDVIEAVARDYRPLVVWGSHIPGQHHCAIGVDNFTGGRLLGERLIGHGATRIAFMGEIRTLEIAERYRGLCAAAGAAGIATPIQLNTHMASDVMGAEITANLDHVAGAIDAIACASDVIARQTVRILADRGLSVPGDLRVTGFDNLPFTEQMVPSLTTISQDLVTGSAAMIDALFARMDGVDAPSVEMTPRLIVRDSA